MSLQLLEITKSVKIASRATNGNVSDIVLPGGFKITSLFRLFTDFYR